MTDAPRVLVTGANQGIGRETARRLLAAGARVLVHARTPQRLDGIPDLLADGAVGVAGELADPAQVRRLAQQVLDAGGVDAVVHNAGVMTGPDIAAVNVVAPYLLTALLPGASRHVSLSSGMHRGGRAQVPEPVAGSRITYSDSKLLVTALALGLARTDPSRRFNAVDPGWVPTRMGGRSAPDDLGLGAETQVWLASAPDAGDVTGGYWFHRQQQPPQRAATDPGLQDRLLDALRRETVESSPQRGAGRP